MKRLAPYLAFVVGIGVTMALLPLFNAAQPRGIRLTRREAIPIADAAARGLDIPVEKAWSDLSWLDSPLLDKELEPKPDLRRRAGDDPVIGPRLGSYRQMYYRRGLQKSPPYGFVCIDPNTGDVLSARLRLRPEEIGAQSKQADLLRSPRNSCALERSAARRHRNSSPRVRLNIDRERTGHFAIA